MQNPFFVERNQCARVDHLGLDPFLGQHLCCLQRTVEHEQGSHNRDVLSGSAHRRFPDRHDVLFVGHLAFGADGTFFAAGPFGAVEKLVFKKEHRVVIADGRFEQPFGVVGCGRGDHLQPGHMGKKGLRALRMLCPARGRPNRCPHDHRHSQRAGRHVPQFGGLVDQLVHHVEEKIAVLYVGHRPHAAEGRADGNAGDGRFGDRRITHPLAPKFLRKAQRHCKCPPKPARHANILPQQEDAWVTAHLFAQRLTQRFGNRHLSHRQLLCIDIFVQRHGFG